MQSVEVQGMEEFESMLSNLLEEIPEARRELHENIGELVKKEIELQIQASGINDSGGKVRGWQQARVGSKGGYVAISAEKGETGPNSPGAITNYLENGHTVRRPTGSAKRIRRGRAKQPYVDGFHFYQKTKRETELIAIREAQRYVDEVTRRLEG